ncbi:atpase aaa+ type core [Diplodia corticola]|uniref:Atpase aaa+ type core n=1 Tax=Diplodia corticola TaxID=236234 RepID=A0A1J9QWB1_9PEZI|nr:atpase aaa+ type core [Diplodia corticola]OJD32290.1 atpase aaa+ type core [Diplodia corticola]
MENDVFESASDMDEDSQRLEDPFAHAFGTAEDEGAMGIDCEIKTYDGRYNSKGERVFLQVGKKSELLEDKDSDFNSALVLKRIFNHAMEMKHTELYIQSPHMKKALRETIQRYPGVDLHAPSIIIINEPRCIFHYRKELEAYRKTLQDEDEQEHVRFLLQYTFRALHRAITSFVDHIEQSTSEPGLEYQNLWMLFRPGDILLYKLSKSTEAMRFRSMELQFKTPTSKEKDWVVTADVMNYDGNVFGTVAWVVRIAPYQGWKPVRELIVFPLEYHPEKGKVREQLLERGRKFVSLREAKHQYYNGEVMALSRCRKGTFLNDTDSVEAYETTVKGRIMIDVKTFDRVLPRHSIDIEYENRTYSPEKDEHLGMSETDLITCAHDIPGYSFANGQWALFEVDKIEDVKFNDSAFDQLILPLDQKEMISSVVRVHSTRRVTFDDIISGKGKGIVFLLHGDAGVGKTLTAESVADFTKRPLFTVGCGDLGVDAFSVEENLDSTFELALTWNAIVLLDEADIFLETRAGSNHDLKRNAIVSVFLRMLEYFEGMLFLTTNRVRSIDAAFRSRIHIAIHYPALTFDSRRELWKTFIQKATSEVHFWWAEEYLDHLASQELNGRQIKNIVRTAHSVAVGEGGFLNSTHINSAMVAMMAFDASMAEPSPLPLIQ